MRTILFATAAAAALLAAGPAGAAPAAPATASVPRAMQNPLLRVDMKLHLAGDTKIDDPDAFEAATLKELGMPEEIVMRHRTPQFLHVFSSDGYSAGYYSYLWTDVLAADAAEAFAEAPGGFYDKAVAKRLHDEVMSKGNSVDPADQYRAFRGRDPKVEALMRARGFAPPLDAKPASN
jgi:peptidyl-dipeptidase Dcp